MSQSSCAKCIHCGRLSEADGICTRFPPTATVILVPEVSLMASQPQLVPQNFTAWPNVRMDQFCGEFAARHTVLAS